MAKITLQQPSGSYKCELDTDSLEVRIQEAFLGIQFVSDSGEHLAVCMRDTGFEIHYWQPSTDQTEPHIFDAGWIDLKDGIVIQRKGIHATT